MKIILLQDVPKLGHKNEIKEVSDGYARNFLFSRNLAKPATEAALKQISLESQKQEKEKSEAEEKSRALAKRIEETTLSFQVRVGEKGRAFGSVTAVKIKEALKKHGIEVEKDWIELKDSLKTAGETKVKIKLPRGTMGEVTIKIQAEK